MRGYSLLALAFLGLSFGSRFSPEGIPGLNPSKASSRPISSKTDLYVDLNDREACLDGLPDGDQPDSRGNTTVQVENLIDEMIIKNFAAYIIPSSDSHQSEYLSAADERRVYISGFTGSAGTAVVLADGQRALWTDARYWLPGDQQLDCSWLFMRDGDEGVPSISEWLKSVLQNGSAVGADARLFGADYWLSLSSSLSDGGLTLEVETIDGDGNNVVDLVWNDDGRPPYSMDELFVHPIEYAGVDWRDKIRNVQAEMEQQGADAIIFTALDENAWLLNCRGLDIPYNPVFRSFVIIDLSGGGDPQVGFFIPDSEVKVNSEVRDHLDIQNCQAGEPCVTIQEYDSIREYIENMPVTKFWMPSSYYGTYGVSYYIYDSVPDSIRFSYRSPVQLSKASKNEIERSAMRNSNFYDSVGLVAFLAYLEGEIKAGNYLTEMQADAVMASYRSAQPDYIGLSFGSISAYGANGAIIHYSASSVTDTSITTDNLYLLDSGGQYLGGTTDVTRTMHYGTPTDYQIETYTLVLQGHLDFAGAVFPKGTSKSYIEVLARQYLYQNGLDYKHGTSHGIGICLNVHESSDYYFEYGFHGTVEPGYYLDGEFGIRIENVVALTNVTTKYNFTEESYGFEMITLVPYEPNLIDYSLLTTAQCNMLNEYNTKIWIEVGGELKNQEYNDAYTWLETKVQNVTC